MRKVTLKQVGYKITGMAHLKMWGGGEADIEMIPTSIYGKITKSRVLSAINDSQFGCEAILSVDIDVHDLFENDYSEFNRMIEAGQQSCKNAQRGI